MNKFISTGNIVVMVIHSFLVVLRASIGGLIFTEGGIVNFLELALGFTGGHFQERGGNSASNELSVFAKIKIFLFTNIFWWGLFSRTHVLMVLYIVIGILIFLPRTKSKLFKNMPFILSILMISAYCTWALFAQNIDKPCHILPVALILIFLVLVALKEQRNPWQFAVSCSSYINGHRKRG